MNFVTVLAVYAGYHTGVSKWMQFVPEVKALAWRCLSLHSMCSLEIVLTYYQLKSCCILWIHNHYFWSITARITKQPRHQQWILSFHIYGICLIATLDKEHFCTSIFWYGTYGNKATCLSTRTFFTDGTRLVTCKRSQQSSQAYVVSCANKWQLRSITKLWTQRGIPFYSFAYTSEC